MIQFHLKNSSFLRTSAILIFKYFLTSTQIIYKTIISDWTSSPLPSQHDIYSFLRIIQLGRHFRRSLVQSLSESRVSYEIWLGFSEFYLVLENFQGWTPHLFIMPFFFFFPQLRKTFSLVCELNETFKLLWDENEWIFRSRAIISSVWFHTPMQETT